ncbi:putative enoyl-CoA hydratase EchA13 [subsurface metagenome]
MNPKYVIYEKEGEVARITLNRPDKLNAMDFPGDAGIQDDFSAALDEAANDDGLKVVIIKGAGRSFCVGHDLERIYRVYEEWDMEPGKRRPSQRSRLNVDRRWYEVSNKLLLHPRVTIAQVHGHCIGEGAMIAEMCDICIVAEDAHISHAEQRLGFAGSGINLVPLFQTVGYKKARWMCLTGDAIDGKEAERIGWATKVVRLDKLEEEVEKTAKEICLLPKDGIAIGKASNHWLLDILGMTKGYIHGYLTHTLFTNLRYEPGEWIFVKDRKDKGARTGFHKRDERYIDTR